jgi:hypothetical protein
MTQMALRISNLRLGLDEPESAVADELARSLGVAPEVLGPWRILRKSLDARVKYVRPKMKACFYNTRRGGVTICAWNSAKSLCFSCRRAGMSRWSNGRSSSGRVRPA